MVRKYGGSLGGIVDITNVFFKVGGDLPIPDRGGDGDGDGRTD